MAMNLHNHLQARFGFENFRQPQEGVIRHVLARQSALLLLPTGVGKSLCYQFPASLGQDLVLVVSPLIALMQDQAKKAELFGISTSFINSTLKPGERKSRLVRLKQKKFNLLFVTPERFRKGEFLEALQPNIVRLLAVDEAHCISQWGQDFRPEYSRLGEIRQSLGNPPVLALTATATPRVQADICQQLEIFAGELKIFAGGIERPNLSLNVRDLYGVDQKVQSLMALHHQHPGAAVVYFSLISTLEKINFELRRLGLETYTYHGQMSASERHRQQQGFFESSSQWILATPAFGLGIDKPDIRQVIHAEIPGSIESYYQEVGRAGRDGLPAQAHLLFDEDDISIQMDFMSWSNPDPGFIRKVYQMVRDYRERIYQEGLDFLRSQLLFYNRRDFRLETALNLLKRWECVAAADERKPNLLDIVGELPEDLLVEDLWQHREKHMNEMLLQMVQFAKMSTGCRQQMVYQYFGVSSDPSCGRCDLCLKK